jgi:hypothetical protein
MKEKKKKKRKKNKDFKLYMLGCCEIGEERKIHREVLTFT